MGFEHCRLFFKAFTSLGQRCSHGGIPTTRGNQFPRCQNATSRTTIAREYGDASSPAPGFRASVNLNPAVHVRRRGAHSLSLNAMEPCSVRPPVHRLPGGVSRANWEPCEPRLDAGSWQVGCKILTIQATQIRVCWLYGQGRHLLTIGTCEESSFTVSQHVCSAVIEGEEGEARPILGVSTASLGPSEGLSTRTPHLWLSSQRLN